MAKRGAKLIYELDEFKRLYAELKQPGVTDKEIATKLLIDVRGVYHYKKRCGIVTNRQTLKKGFKTDERF